jgi:hypothetical protein
MRMLSSPIMEVRFTEEDKDGNKKIIRVPSW